MRMIALAGLAVSLCVLEGCDDQRVDLTERESTQLAADVQPASASDTLEVTYVCGNLFRIRNPDTTEVGVVWTLGGTPPGRNVWAGGRHTGTTHRDTYVDAGGPGAFHWRTRLKIGTPVANGGAPACQPPSPPFPLSPNNLPTVEGTDDTLTVADPTSPGTAILRRQALVLFDGSASADSIEAFMRRFRARVLSAWTFSAGGQVRAFSVIIPDPGPTLASLQSVLATMRTVVGVRTATYLTRGESTLRPGRFPTDAHANRSAYLESPTTATWAARALRLPQAWSCENGRYAAPLVRVSIVDAAFRSTSLLHPDLASSVTRADTTAPSALGARVAKPSNKVLNHGSKAMSVLTATGDNGTGIAGVLWSSSAQAISTIRHDTLPNAHYSVVYSGHVVPAIKAHKPRVISMSMAETSGDAGQQQAWYTVLLAMLDASENSLLVIGVDDNSTPVTTGTSLAWGTSKAGNATAVKNIQDFPQYRERILTVTATRPGNRKATFAPWSTTLTDIASPGENIPLLSDGTVATDSGVSFAVPMVAGVAAALVAMDSALTPAQVRDYILRGARTPQEDPATGAITVPTKVQGAPNGEEVYELDAYGSLRLLSNSRPRTPLCGVRLAADTVTQFSSAIVALRDSAPREFVGLVTPSNSWPQQLASGVASGAIARGGRVVATGGGFSDNAVEYRLSSSGWTETPLPGINLRLYSERDTIDVRHSFPNVQFGRSPIEVRIRGESPGNTSIWRSVGRPVNQVHYPGFSVNATGDWLHWSAAFFDTNSGSDDPPVPYFSETGLVRLRSNSPEIVIDSGSASYFAWRPDGLRGVSLVTWAAYSGTPPDEEFFDPFVASRAFTGFPGTPTAGGASITRNGRFPTFASASPAGGSLLVVEIGDLGNSTPNCFRTTRRFSEPNSVLATTVFPARSETNCGLSPSQGIVTALSRVVSR
jgi:hypothetical protein